MNILCISDIHQKHHKLSLPDCDVLIIAGDVCSSGELWEFEQFVDWLKKESCKFKRALIVAGNHDWCFARHKSLCVDILNTQLGNKAAYLEDSAVVVDGIKFYGSPWQPEFSRWAFNVPRGERLKNIWANIPDDTDVLITHGPPHGIGDLVHNAHVGCVDLFNRVCELSQHNLFLHVFGHIHSGSGYYTSDAMANIAFCNAAICTENYTPDNMAHMYILSNLGTHHFLTCTTMDLSAKHG